jgi:hypothetical protein
MRYCYAYLCLLTLLAVACKSPEEKPAAAKERVVSVPSFSGDSSYHFVKMQVEFGPRIPNTAAHRNTADYLIGQFRKYGASVTTQDFTASTYEGQKLALRNIVASYAPEKQKRILLAAHWDTRPFSDKDPAKPRSSFEGANDGASGVGVLLEVARHLGRQAPQVGVDIILFDGEDWGYDAQTADVLHGGDRNFPLPPDLQSWWCLGSQHWAKHKHKPNYSAYYAILLDMVGAKDSKFFREGVSMEYAPGIVDKVWSAAARLGYSGTFVKQNVGAITDDHVFVNEIGRIPMINIVHYDPVSGFFGDYHHSQSDNLSLISPEVLGIVGRTLLQVVYYEE